MPKISTTRRIPKDKWRHAIVGILMGAFLQLVALYRFPAKPLLAAILAFGVVVFISYGFELFSKFTGKGIYDFWDAVASVIGGVAGMAIGAGVYLLMSR